MGEFFRKYVLMMGVPRREQITHWIVFAFFSIIVLWFYINGSLLIFSIATYIFGGFFFVHALYLRYRYDNPEEEIPSPRTPL